MIADQPIDHSEWLAKWNITRTDIEVDRAESGRLLRVRVSQRCPYEILADRNQITGTQVSLGHRYLAMKTAFTSKLSYAKMQALLKDLFEGEQMPDGHLERLYHLIAKALPKQSDHTIVHAMTESCPPELVNLKYRKLEQLTAQYTDAFFKLEVAFTRCQKHLDNLLEEERNMTPEQKERDIANKMLALFEDTR